VIAALVRRDPDFRHLRWGLFFAALVGAWFGWIFRSELADEVSARGKFAAGTSLLWMGGISFSLLGVLVGLGGVRAHAHCLPLPIPGRQLLLARWTTLALLLILPLLLYLGILAAWSGSAEWALRFARAGLSAALAWCLALALLTRLHPARPRASFRLTAPLLLLFAPGLTWLLHWADSAAAYAAAALAAALLLLDVRRAAPAALMLAPQAADRAAEEVRAVRGKPARALILRAVLFHPGALLYLGLLGFLVLISCGTDGRLTASAYWFMVSFWSLSSFVANSSVLRVTDTLPLSRRQIFPWIVGPTVLGLAISVLTAVEVQSLVLHAERPGIVRLEWNTAAHPIHLDVSVPPRFWQLSERGGETVTGPDGTSVFSPARTILGRASPYYNPFHVEPDSSDTFVAWQLGRALSEVHGYVADAPLQVERDANGFLIAEGWFPDDLRPPGPGKYAPARILLVMTDWSLALLLALLIATWNAKPAVTRLGQRLQAPLVWVAVLVLTIFGSIFLLDQIHGREADWVHFLAEDWLTRRPLVLACAWLLWMALSVLCWRWMRSRFERMEIGPLPLRTEEMTPRARRWLRI